MIVSWVAIFNVPLVHKTQHNLYVGVLFLRNISIAIIMQTSYTYILLTSAAAVVMLMLGCMLLVIRIPREERTAKLRVARLCLALSYFILSIPHFIECCCKTNPDVDARILASFTLATAAFQSLLFTATILTFILPDYVTRRRTLCQMGGVVIGVAIFLVTVFAYRDPYPVLYAGLAAYFGQLIYYTLLFRRKYTESLRRLEEYYDDDAYAQLKWVKCSFYTALTIGVMASVSVYFPSHFALYFTIVYIVFYAWFANRFSNYAAKVNYFLPAVTHTEQKTEITVTAATDTDFTSVENEAKTIALHQAIERWVAERGYVKSEVGIEEIAAELGTNIDFLRYYFRTYMSSDFRPWRGELRIREAQRIMNEEPELSVSQVSERVGISDRSNFRSQFCKIVGMSPAEYRHKSQSK